MELLILGGTAWLGRTVAQQALVRGHAVTCLARGVSGDVPDGASLLVADRMAPGAYDAAARDWDAVLDVSWQPGQVRSALAALAPRAAHWLYVSSVSVYADHAQPGAAESDPVLDPSTAAEADLAGYGEAKVACEQAAVAAMGDRLLIARAGLIGGAGDPSDRTGAWVARAAAAPEDPLLIPDDPPVATQVVDVTDLARWLVTSAEHRLAGTFDAVGPSLAFEDWIALCRLVGGHTGPVRRASVAWLAAQGVGPWMGPDSLAMWLGEVGSEGWAKRSGAAAAAAGLAHRPRVDLLSDLLEWERGCGLHRDRRAGLSLARESELLAALAP